MKNNNNKDNFNISNIIQTEPSQLSEEFQVVASAKSEGFVVVNKENIPDSRPSSPFEVIDDPSRKNDLTSSEPFCSPRLSNASKSDGKNDSCTIS
jgi:hypothetical protein